MKPPEHEFRSFLAHNSRYTARYALHVGALCRKMTVKDVAHSERLHHSTVKELDKVSMAEQLRRHPMPATSAIGVDEIAIRKGHDYRVVVSDLNSRRPIWFGGREHKQEDLALFFKTYGARRCAGIQVAVMDIPPDRCVEALSPRHEARRPPRLKSCSTSFTSCAI